ncbi:MAG: hypothetical protein RH860_03340 [Cytophagales bacterium]
MKFTKIFILIFLAISYSLQAQVQLNWPEDKARAQTEYTLMNDLINSDQEDKAQKHWNWLYTNAPDLDNSSYSLYKQGEKIFNTLVKNTEDKELQKAYQDSALLNLQERIDRGDDKKDVMNRMGYFLFPYWINRPDKRAELLDKYKEILDLNGNDAYYINAKYFFKTAYYNVETGAKLTDEQIIEAYDFVNNIVEFNINKGGKNVEKWQSVKNEIDNDLAKLVDIDCDFISKNWVPKFKANPEDLKMAKKIFSGMLTAKCTDNQVWLEAGELINKIEPNFGLAKNLGRRFQSEGAYEKAIAYFERAVEMAKTPQDKGEVNYYLALTYYQKGSKSTARNYAFKTIQADPGQAKDAYSLIGDLYMNSYNDCKADNIVDSRAVYIAAYDMYSKAGNTEKMQNAKAQFPSIEEIFTQGKKEGDQVTISCWINETVQLQRRPQ